MAKKKARRSPEETAIAVAEVNKLREGGMTAEDAVHKVGIVRSVYNRHMASGTTGSVSASSLPPRPTKKKHGGRQPVDMNSVKSIAGRITSLDIRIDNFQDLVQERERLAERLLILLKPK